MISAIGVEYIEIAIGRPIPALFGHIVRLEPGLPAHDARCFTQKPPSNINETFIYNAHNIQLNAVAEARRLG